MVAILPNILPRDDPIINANTDTPYDESKRNLSESGDKIRLRSLGDGPCAPDAAGEAAQEDVEDEDLEVSPGYKGWINLVGVGRY